jgi:ribonucleoside-triphosphate reductase
MDIAKESLEIKRETIENLLEKNFVPYTKSYLGHFSNHFSTIGLCGMNEACINLFNEDISTEKGKIFTIDTMNFMRTKIKQYQKETNNLYNLEATPAESTSYRFAKKDKEIYPNIHVSGKEIPFLTNSTQLPVDADITLNEALKHQEEIQTLYTGGTIFHTFLGERIDKEATKNLVRKISENTKIPYFSITPIFSICDNHGYLPGKQEHCPTCNKETEIYDRIVGYLRPISKWNIGKREGEFPMRKRINKEGVYEEI